MRCCKMQRRITRMRVVQRNAPYGPEHGVTHTLKEHGIANGHMNVMLEIRNDLIDTPERTAPDGRDDRRLALGCL